MDIKWGWRNQNSKSEKLVNLKLWASLNSELSLVGNKQGEKKNEGN